MTTTKESNIRFIEILLFLSVLTCSFDIVLNIEINGYNIRFTQLMLILPIVIFGIKFIEYGKLILPLGFIELTIYVLLNTVFLLNAKYLITSIGYEFWLLLNYFTIPMVVAFFGENIKKLRLLLRIFILSFVFVSVIGILQLIMFKLFDINLYMVQFDGKNGRINGFCFEPSYYTTYLITGFILVFYLIETQNSFLFSKKIMKLFSIIIGSAIIFSTSRMGILAVVMFICYRVLALICKVLHIRGTRLKFSINDVKRLALYTFLLMAFVYIAFYMVKYHKNIVLRLLSGIGIGGTSAHSSKFRIEGMNNVIELIKSSPLIGCSLGDITPRICSFYTGPQTSACVLLEQFAATGIIGGMCFSIYMAKLCLSYKKLKKFQDHPLYDVLKGMCLGVFFQFILLNMNQNILRPYVWINYSILSAVFCNIIYVQKECL